MSWDEMWGYYLECDKDIRKRILEQIDLKTFIRNKSPKIQIEILQHAPQDVIKSLTNILEPATKKKLGVSSTSLFEIEKQIKRMIK